jgi:hypothetical protein
MKHKHLAAHSKEELVRVLKSGCIGRSPDSLLFIRLLGSIIAGIAMGAFALYVLSFEGANSTAGVAHVLPVALLIMMLFLIQLRFLNRLVDNTAKLHALIEFLERCDIIKC